MTLFCKTLMPMWMPQANRTFGLEPTGRVVVEALNKEAQKAKQKINEAYRMARESGETEAPVVYAPFAPLLKNKHLQHGLRLLLF